MTCAYCTDGWVVAQLRDHGNGYVDEMAPCPFCENGGLRELAVYPNGFWKGRDHSFLEPLNTSSRVVPPPAGFVEVFQRLVGDTPATATAVASGKGL